MMIPNRPVPLHVRTAARITRLLPALPGCGFVAENVRRFCCRGVSAAIEYQYNGVDWELFLGELTESAVYFFPQLYNRREIRFLENILRPDDTFIDLGANIGFFALTVAQLVGKNGKSLAVEADPQLAKRISFTAQRCGLSQVRVLPTAVSDTVGSAEFVVSRNGNRGGSGLRNSTLGAPPNDSVLTVPTVPLLKLLHDQGITSVRAVKADLEGHEAVVFNEFFRTAPESLWPAAAVIECLRGHSNANSALEKFLSVGYLEVDRSDENCLLVLPDR